MLNFKRNDRISLLTKMLVEKPNHIFSLDFFADLFGVGKSTVSEDIAVIKDVMARVGMGEIKTVLGAAGGVLYVPDMPLQDKEELISQLADMISQPERIIPGGYLYMNDILYMPELVERIGLLLATYFVRMAVDYVVTVETKGIPLAMMVARVLNRPLIIVRRENRVTEGSSISINYISGSAKRIQTMSISRRAVPPGSKVVFIDDFMKAGGTAKGILDLMKEMNAEVLNTGVLIATAYPQQKLVDNYMALLTLYDIDEDKQRIDIRPNALY